MSGAGFGGEFDRRNDRDRLSLDAEEFGVSGRRFLELEEHPRTVKALGEVLSERMEAMLPTSRVRQLHPLLDEGTVQYVTAACRLSILQATLTALLDCPARVLQETDVRQVLSGTSMATKEAAAQICMALGVKLSDMLAEARVRGGEWTVE